MAAAYRDRILAALPAGCRFEPLMTLYLTDTTSPQEIRAAQGSGFIFGAKLYPAGATTHSDAGVTAIEKIYPALEAMQDCGLVFQVHGEVTDSDVDVFDRERVFIDRILAQVVERFPALRIVFEHVTTREAVQFVKSARRGVGATITPQHLLLNRNAIFQGGIRPHNYCLPVLKREHDRRALIEAATERRHAFLPRHRQRAAREAYQGNSLRLRRNFLRARRHRAVRGSVRAGRQARSAAGVRRRSAARTSTACRATREHITLERAAWSPPPAYRFRRGRARAISRRRTDRLAHGRGAACVSDRLPMASRFRGFLPVVIDVECGGFNPNTDALLEIAAVLIEIQADGSARRPARAGAITCSRSRARSSKPRRWPSTASIRSIRCGRRFRRRKR